MYISVVDGRLHEILSDSKAHIRMDDNKFKNKYRILSGWQ